MIYVTGEEKNQTCHWGGQELINCVGFWFFSSSNYELKEGAFKVLLVKFFHLVEFPANVSSQQVCFVVVLFW